MKDSHLWVYRQLTDIRHRHAFSLTALTSTAQVFSFLRHGPSADLVVAMNVMEEEASVSLTSLLLEVGLTSWEGTVLVRSSGELYPLGRDQYRDCDQVWGMVGMWWEPLWISVT